MMKESVAKSILAIQKVVNGHVVNRQGGQYLIMSAASWPAPTLRTANITFAPLPASAAAASLHRHATTAQVSASLTE